MSSKRVPIARGGEPSIPVEVGATVGATVGVNLRWEDGTLVTREDLAPEPPAEGMEVTYWRMIREIPANVVALAETTTTGLYAITGDGASATREIQPVAGETTVSNGDGVAGDPVVGLADVADSGSGALLAITRDAKGRVSGTKNATITGTAGQIEVADGDAVAGLPTISLADVTPTPGGTLQRYGFDAKGRRIEEEAADTDDLAEGASNLYFTNDRADARITAQKGQPNGLATLDADAKLEANQLPALAITDTFVVNTEAAMLALDAQQGDVAVRTDEQKSYILTADPASTLSNWQELLTPTGTGGTVTSVALSVPTGLTVSGSPITSSGTITVNYDTGYQGYTSAEASKLSGIEAGATVGADWSVNLSNIPANIASWAGIPPADKADAAALANYLPLAGGTMAGHLIIGNAFDLRMDSTTPATRVIRWMTGGSNRWTLFANASAESGGNAGSDLVLQAYSDAGAPLGAVLTVSRATGIAAFSQRPTFGGSTPWDDANLTPVNATGNQTGLAGDKTWTGAHTFTQSPTAITFGAGGATVGGNSSGVAVLGANSNNIFLRPNGAGSTVGQLSLTPAGVLTVGGARVWDAASLVVATGTATWNPPSIPINGSATTTVTVPGAVMGDIVLASFSLDLQGMTLSAYVSSPGTVTVVLTNNTAAAINLASGTLKAMVIRA